MSFDYDIQFADPNRILDPQECALLRLNAAAALNQWAEHICGTGKLVVEVLIADTKSGRFGGASVTNEPTGDMWEGYDVVEESAVYRGL